MPTPSTDPEAALAKELWEKSADAWLVRVDQDANRAALLDPVMLAWAGPRGCALDVGCGEGRFCRRLAERGFATVGLDLTPNLLSKAAELDPTSPFVRGDGAVLPLRSEAFDLTISYLSLLDIADYRAAISELVRATKPGGRILIANCTPFYTPLESPWHRDESGEKLHVRLDDYVREHAVRVAWAGIDIINYHRSYSDYFGAFLSLGLRLEHFEEVIPSAEAIEDHPHLGENLRVPGFFVMAWRKE